MERAFGYLLDSPLLKLINKVDGDSKHLNWVALRHTMTRFQSQLLLFTRGHRSCRLWLSCIRKINTYGAAAVAVCSFSFRWKLILSLSILLIGNEWQCLSVVRAWNGSCSTLFHSNLNGQQYQWCGLVGGLLSWKVCQCILTFLPSPCGRTSNSISYLLFNGNQIFLTMNPPLLYNNNRGVKGSVCSIDGGFQCDERIVRSTSNIYLIHFTQLQIIDCDHYTYYIWTIQKQRVLATWHSR